MIDRERLLNQLKEDEGFVGKAYWDIKQWSFGYGCKAPGEGAYITEPEAASLLEAHMDDAIAHFDRIFKDHLQKFNDVRAECFINMIFNMGPGRPNGSEGLLSFKNTLALIFKNREVPWEQVSKNLVKSLWYRQVGNRAERIVEEVKTGVKA
jgi:lysozyme